MYRQFTYCGDTATYCYHLLPLFLLKCNQVRGDVWAEDMWSLGCISIELFVGEPVFPHTGDKDDILQGLGLWALQLKTCGWGNSTARQSGWGSTTQKKTGEIGGNRSNPRIDVFLDQLDI